MADITAKIKETVMIYITFLLAGFIASIHIFSYGLWLKREGNLPGFVLTLLTAALATGLPLYNVLRR